MAEETAAHQPREPIWLLENEIKRPFVIRHRREFRDHDEQSLFYVDKPGESKFADALDLARRNFPHMWREKLPLSERGAP